MKNRLWILAFLLSKIASRLSFLPVYSREIYSFFKSTCLKKYKKTLEFKFENGLWDSQTLGLWDSQTLGLWDSGTPGLS
jgi:hypothetical protein